MASKEALEKSAQAWCTKATEHLEMIPALTKAFADILDKELNGTPEIKIGSLWKGIYTGQSIEVTNIVDGEVECTYDDGDVLLCELNLFRGEYVPK